jgi:hypothetical protein
MNNSNQNRNPSPVDEVPVDEVPVDDLDRKLLDTFAGRVVRKDLVKRLKVGFNIPVYVLEYLLENFVPRRTETRSRPVRGRSKTPSPSASCARIRANLLKHVSRSRAR